MIRPLRFVTHCLGIGLLVLVIVELLSGGLSIFRKPHFRRVQVISNITPVGERAWLIECKDSSEPIPRPVILLGRNGAQLKPLQSALLMTADLNQEGALEQLATPWQLLKAYHHWLAGIYLLFLAGLLTFRSTRTPPALAGALFLVLAISAPLVASAQAGPVSFIR